MTRLHTAGCCAALTTLGGVFISAGLAAAAGFLLHTFTKPVTTARADLVLTVNPLELPPPDSRS